MNKKIIALLLALVMILCCFVACGKERDNTGDRAIAAGTKVILGSSTKLSGDFRFPGFGGAAGASDRDIAKLTVGYGTMEIDRYGTYVWNETSVKSYTEKENKDGTYTVTVELNEGLKFSDGSDIKAVNYVASILAFSSPVSFAAGHSGTAGQFFVGYDTFKAYGGKETKGATKEFSGVRLLGDYTFSYTVSSDFYPYYFAYTYAATEPAPLGLILGEGVEIKDDGNGCYLSDNYYEMDGKEYVKAKELADNRYDVTKYPFSGAYMIKEWDNSTSRVTLAANPEFKGNFEGMTPAIETIVYIPLVSETQLEALTSGGVDILGGITGGNDIKAALAVTNDGSGRFAETHYQRAGYGKVQFDCDFGPTMFAEVRQAIAYLLNREELCQSFTGGYGTIVDGPYSPDFAMWQAVKNKINLTDYSYSPAKAKKLLEGGGWIYNSHGEAYAEGQSGVDAVRYKKLSAEEAEILDGVNKTYASVANTDGITYKTVEINGEYYMPLVINWFCITPGTVTDLLSAALVNSTDVAAAGIVIRETTGDFDRLQGEIYREPTYGYGGIPTYGMYNLSISWPSAVYDYAFNWSLDPAYFDYSVNKFYDEYDKAFPYDMSAERLSYKQALEQSGGKLGMDYLSMAMVYNAKTEDEYNEWWQAYIERWNQLMPDIPLYSNYYYDVYNANIENFETSPFFGPAQAILYANVKS